MVEAMLWAEVMRDPMKRRSDYAQILTDRLHINVDSKSALCVCFLFALNLTFFCFSCRWVGRAFRRLHFSSKVAKYRNLNKFSLANALYTSRYLLGIQRFDWRLLKFFDEVRFVASCFRCLTVPAVSL